MVAVVDDIHQNTGITLLDISPGNIMMCNDGQANKQFKFLDLAFARFFNDKTAGDMVFGTLWYRSPFAIVLEEYFDQKLIPLVIINDNTKTNEKTQGNLICFTNLKSKLKQYCIKLGMILSCFTRNYFVLQSAVSLRTCLKKPNFQKQKKVTDVKRQILNINRSQ
jgi:serine/threonine protein kinase